MTPDADLIEKACRGDMIAFEQLVHRHDRQVLSIAARYAGSAEDAKDIYQEVFVRVWRGIASFRYQSDFRTWLHRITVNVCLSHRSRQALAPVVAQGREDEGFEPQDKEDLPDALAIRAELAERVQRAMEALSARQRMAFTLRHHEGYKIREIASMMSCMEGTVKRYLFTATERMRRELKDYL